MNRNDFERFASLDRGISPMTSKEALEYGMIDNILTGKKRG